MQQTCGTASKFHHQLLVSASKIVHVACIVHRLQQEKLVGVNNVSTILKHFELEAKVLKFVFLYCKERKKKGLGILEFDE